MSLNTRRQKVKNLETEPACTVLLLDLQNPYRYLEIRGTAVVAPDEDRAFAERVGAKYGADLSEHDAPGDRRVIVRIVPVRVNAVNMRGLGRTVAGSDERAPPDEADRRRLPRAGPAPRRPTARGRRRRPGRPPARRPPRRRGRRARRR